MRAILLHLPEDAALRREVLGDQYSWGLSELLLASVLDTVRWIAWTKTKDGHKNRNQPKPIPRPGVTGLAGERINKHDAVKSLTVDEYQALLDRPRTPLGG